MSRANGVVQSGDADVLDARDPVSRTRRGRAGRWAVAVTVVVLLCGWWLRPGQGTGGDDVGLSLVDHSGSALDGQRFVRFHFSVVASGGTARVEQVEMVLGGTRSDGVAPASIGDGSPTKVLVDVVPDCPHAVRDLPAGTLEVTYRAGEAQRVAHLPLPIEGSLPRLVLRRCAQQDTT